MRKKIFTILILIAVAFCPHYASAQKTISKADAEAEAALRDKAYALLETLAGQLGTMQSPENRARIGSNIAGSLWTHNETRARELIAAVQQDINAGLQAVADTEDREDSETLAAFLRLRTDTINRIIRYDPELAYEFFIATALNPDLKLSEQAKETDRTLEMNLARQFAGSNPDLALKIARKVLARGVSDELPKIYRQLNRKHKEQATALYKEIVQKLGEVDLATDWNYKYFAISFAHAITPPDIDEANFNELVNVFAKTAVAHGCNKKMSEEDERAQACSNLAPLMAVVAKVNPSRARQFATWTEEEESEELQLAPMNELEETATEGTVEDVLALTVKYPQMEDEIRWRAFSKARYDDDLETAQKIAGGSRDSEWKKRMVAELNAVETRKAATEATLAELQKSLSEVKSPIQRLMLLAMAANDINGTNHKAAIKLLNQASQIVETLKPGSDRLAGQLVLGLLYSYLKDERGLDMMEALVPKLNELIEASAKLDGIEHRYLREGEWNMSKEGTLGDYLNFMAENAGYFARCDFDRSVSLAAQFDRPEIRIMAQLKLAQGILAGPLKPLPFLSNRYQYIH